jgi:DNA-directed RNA polymerase specialized sigma24 family protein
VVGNAAGLLRHCLDIDVSSSRAVAERRFAELFDHLALVIAYARRRGSLVTDATAAEVVTIAWCRFPTIPDGDPRPWLIATARNLLMNEWRRAVHERAAVAQFYASRGFRSEPSKHRRGGHDLARGPATHQVLTPDRCPASEQPMLDCQLV